MRVLVTGSSGHLGEALVRVLSERDHDVIAVDLKNTPYTNYIGSINDLSFIDSVMAGVDVVLHAATLHKPHVMTHSCQDFVDTNITGTLTLLEAAVKNKVQSFIFTSTTSLFGDAMVPVAGAPAIWVTEDLVPQPKNIYGVTKLAAENLCQLFYRKFQMPCLILRTSRFFPEKDDSEAIRTQYPDDNAKVNEFLHRRVDLEDVVMAHMLAMEKTPHIGFGRYIICATTPFQKADLQMLRDDPISVVNQYVSFEDEYVRRGWQMFPSIDRVYVNMRARDDLGWSPKYSFPSIIDQLRNGEEPLSTLSRQVGAKGYHDRIFEEGPYPVE